MLALEYAYYKSMEESVSASILKKYLEKLAREGKLKKCGKTRYGDDIYRVC